MKKFSVLAILAIALMSFSCGRTKKVITSEAVNPYGKAVASEPCIELYEQAPYKRAYGNGQHFKEATARNIAELQARAMFARKIEAAVLAATEDIGVSLEKYAADDQSGRSVTDQSGEGNDLAMSIAQQVIRNTHTIKTTRYLKSNNQFTVFVCMEYAGDENTLVDHIEQNVKDRISQDDRAKIEQRHNQFRQRILGNLKE